MAKGLQKGILVTLITSLMFAIENMVVTVKYLQYDDTIGLAIVQLAITSIFTILLLFFFIYICCTCRIEETEPATQDQQTSTINQRNATLTLVCSTAMCMCAVLIAALGISLDRMKFS